MEAYTMSITKCNECGGKISNKASSCPHCGAPNIGDRDISGNVPLPIFMIFGIIGTILAALGVFLPFMQVPIYGSVNLFHNAQGDGVIIVAMSCLTVLGFSTKKYLITLLPSVVSLSILFFDISNTLTRIQATKENMASALADNPFRGLASGMVESIEISYGAYIIAIGIVISIIAAVWGHKPVSRMRKKEQDPIYLCPNCETKLEFGQLCPKCGLDMDWTATRPPNK
jgi:hypothetical protein